VLRRPRVRATDAGRATRWRRLVAASALATGIGLLFGAGPAASQDSAAAADPQIQQPPRVLVTTVEGTIGPVIADHVSDVVSRAENEGYDALVVAIDTPGGLDTSMRDIIQRFFASEVPIIAYVSPDGARAASAGSFITMAAHVAAMSPGTAIGAATPVQLGGGETTDAERKAIEDAAAYAESIAEARDRNVEFAIETVTESRSVSAAEAVEIGAVDLLARSLPELLDEIDGWTVEVAGDRPVTLTTAGAVVDEADMGFFRQIQQFLADPNLAFLFMSIGTLGLIYELANPGFGVAGVVGAILIILAMFGLAVLPVNVVGILFFVIAILLFIAELFAPGIGVAAAGGTASLLLSGVFLFRGTPGLDVGLGMLIPIAVVVGGFVIVAGRLVMRTRKRSTTTGEGLFIGRTVTVDQVTDERHKTGMAFVEGAWWTVRSPGPPLEVGDARVVGVDGLTLVVEPAAEKPEQQSGADDHEQSPRDAPEESGTDDPTERTVTAERTDSADPPDRTEPTGQPVSNRKPQNKRIGTS
jgi:membrane-bound serine protease (ClpP class)